MKELIDRYISTLPESQRAAERQRVSIALRYAFWKTTPQNTHQRWVRFLKRNKPMKYISLEKAAIIAEILKIDISEIIEVLTKMPQSHESKENQS